MSKQNKLLILLGTASLGLAIICASPHIANAKDHGDDHGNGRGKHEKKWDRDDDNEKHSRTISRSSSYRFQPAEREVIIRYLTRDYGGKCPPGLAKKHNGCIPPGHQARYRPGIILDNEAEWQEPPVEIIEHLRPAPIHTRYVMVDKNVLLVSEATKKILDAVVLLSATE